MFGIDMGIIVVAVFCVLAVVFAKPIDVTGRKEKEFLPFEVEAPKNYKRQDFYISVSDDCRDLISGKLYPCIEGSSMKDRDIRIKFDSIPGDQYPSDDRVHHIYVSEGTFVSIRAKAYSDNKITLPVDKKGIPLCADIQL